MPIKCTFSINTYEKQVRYKYFGFNIMREYLLRIPIQTNTPTLHLKPPPRPTSPAHAPSYLRSPVHVFYSQGFCGSFCRHLRSTARLLRAGALLWSVLPTQSRRPPNCSSFAPIVRAADHAFELQGLCERSKSIAAASHCWTHIHPMPFA